MRSNKIMNSPKNPTLVLGGTGKTGRRIVDRLQKLDLPVRVGSRSAHPPFDWEDRSTWRPALDGITQAYVSYYPDICVPGALEIVQAFFQEALSAGVTKLVLLSGRGEVEAERAENALQATNADWTILRCSFFNQNFSENFFLDPILAGEVALPIGSVAEPFVDAEDIADVAVAALTQTGHSRKLYELTGPRALTFEQAVAEISDVTKRPIRYSTVSADEYATGMRRAQVPEEVIALVLYLFGTVLDGRNTPTVDGVLQALGRQGRDFSDYVRRTAATGVWG
jgi:uncharacterized protein YbjT (DUF2867 family)